MKRLVFCLAVGLFALSQMAVASQQSWKPVGSGDMRWSFFKLYNITLQTQDGNYRQGEKPLALEIRYHRDIKNKHLVEATADQWKKLGVSASQYDQWIDKLSTLWPNVDKGDTLRLEVSDDGSSTFYHNGEMLGVLTDPAFSEAFTDIWLSPKTSRPELRRKLIGGSSNQA